MNNDEFGLRPNFETLNLVQARMAFSLQVKTTRTIKSHFMSDKKFASDLWKCSPKCDNIDSIQHLAFSCPQYEHLKMNRDILNNNIDLVNFFQDVVKLRDEAQT